MPEVEVEKRIKLVDGKEREVTFTTTTGVWETRMEPKGEYYLEKAMAHDYGPGPRNGTTHTRTWKPNRYVPEEEIEYNRARANEEANIAMRARGIW